MYKLESSLSSPRAISKFADKVLRYKVVRKKMTRRKDTQRKIKLTGSTHTRLCQDT